MYGDPVDTFWLGLQYGYTLYFSIMIAGYVGRPFMIVLHSFYKGRS